MDLLEGLYGSVCKCVCVCVCLQCMDSNRGHCLTNHRPSIAELVVTCVDVVKKKGEKVKKNEDIVSCY